MQKSRISSIGENLTGWRVTFYIAARVWWNHWKPPNGYNDTAREEMSSLYLASHIYYGSFIPRTIRYTRGNSDYKLNTEVGLKTEYSYKYYQSTADCCNPCTHKNYTLLAKWGTPLCNYVHGRSRSSKVFKSGYVLSLQGRLQNYLCANNLTLGAWAYHYFIIIILWLFLVPNCYNSISLFCPIRIIIAYLKELVQNSVIRFISSLKGAHW